MHDMNKLSVEVMSTQTIAKNGIQRHNKRAKEDMQKYYTQLEDMKVMGALEPDSTTNPQKG